MSNWKPSGYDPDGYDDPARDDEDDRRPKPPVPRDPDRCPNCRKPSDGPGWYCDECALMGHHLDDE